jgi:hypothetical protein
MSKRMVKKSVSSSWDDYILIELKFFLNLVFFTLLYQKSSSKMIKAQKQNQSAT